jgi:hypothetical protein
MYYDGNTAYGYRFLLKSPFLPFLTIIYVLASRLALGQRGLRPLISSVALLPAILLKNGKVHPFAWI